MMQSKYQFREMGEFDKPKQIRDVIVYLYHRNQYIVHQCYQVACHKIYSHRDNKNPMISHEKLLKDYKTSGRSEVSPVANWIPL